MSRDLAGPWLGDIKKVMVVCALNVCDERQAHHPTGEQPARSMQNTASRTISFAISLTSFSGLGSMPVSKQVLLYTKG